MILILARRARRAARSLALGLVVPALCGASEAALPDGAPPRPAVTPPEAAPAEVFHDATLNLLLTNYANVQHVDGVVRRHAWVQSMQAAFDSGYTGYSGGTWGVGFGVVPFAALTLDAGGKPGNMATGTGGAPKLFLGGYTLNLRAGDSVVKYGLQRLRDPVLESRDTRALPPTFGGVSVVSQLSDSAVVKAGSFDRVLARGRTAPQGLSTSSGGIGFDRLSYGGVEWTPRAGNQLALYVNQAKDVWNQAYASMENTLAGPGPILWKATVNAYYTRASGAALQGDVDNRAFSLGLGATRGRSTVVLSYQHVAGDHYFDYAAESWGDALANSAAQDYNLPHERSLQLRYRFAGSGATLPGLKMDVWIIQGRGADTSSSAARHAADTDPLRALYWKNGAPISGSHHEIGTYISYPVPSGPLRGALVTLFGVAHKGAATYIDSDWREARLMISFPLRVF